MKDCPWRSAKLLVVGRRDGKSERSEVSSSPEMIRIRTRAGSLPLPTLRDICHAIDTLYLPRPSRIAAAISQRSIMEVCSGCSRSQRDSRQHSLPLACLWNDDHARTGSAEFDPHIQQNAQAFESRDRLLWMLMVARLHRSTLSGKSPS